MSVEDIRTNWKTDILGYAQAIPAYKNTPYPAWTVKLNDGYGVAIPYSGADINETFSAVHIYSTESIAFKTGDTRKTLVLVTNSVEMERPFATLCSELIEPGEDGGLRNNILNDPVAWWKKWKELLGNKNIDARVYDVLGELCVLYEMLKRGNDASWNGPDGTSYDIEMDDKFVEVKSTLSRSKREVTISSQFQMDPPGKALDLVLCVFEPTVQNGISINAIIARLRELGCNVNLINQKLAEKGFEEGMSSRDKTFLLHEMLKYVVDADFPRITPASFVGGTTPAYITKISYTVDLSGMPCEPIVQGAITHDIQNH